MAEGVGYDEYQPLDENAPLKTISWENYLASSLNWRGPQSVGHPGVDIGLEARPYTSRIDNIVAARLADLERRGGAGGAATFGAAIEQSLGGIDFTMPTDPANPDLGGVPQRSSFIDDYIQQSISPYQGLHAGLDQAEGGLLAELEASLGLARGSLSASQAAGQGEIVDAASQTDAAIQGLIDAQIQRQGDVQAGTDTAIGSINQSRTDRAAQLLAAIQSSGGDVGQVGGSMLEADTAVSREQMAGQNALSSMFASGNASLASAAASSDLVEQSAMSTLANNFRQASAVLDQSELESRSGIERDFANKRSELNFQIAQATTQARREAEAEQQRRRAAAASAASSKAEAAITQEGIALIAEQYNIPFAQAKVMLDEGLFDDHLNNAAAVEADMRDADMFMHELNVEDAREADIGKKWAGMGAEVSEEDFKEWPAGRQLGYLQATKEMEEQRLAAESLAGGDFTKFNAAVRGLPTTTKPTMEENLAALKADQGDDPWWHWSGSLNDRDLELEAWMKANR